jgi:hypothetical protein
VRPAPSPAMSAMSTSSSLPDGKRFRASVRGKRLTTEDLDKIGQLWVIPLRDQIAHHHNRGVRGANTLLVEPRRSLASHHTSTIPCYPANLDGAHQSRGRDSGVPSLGHRRKSSCTTRFKSADLRTRLPSSKSAISRLFSRCMSR